MKNILIFLAFCSVGCATTNPAMQEQMEVLQVKTSLQGDKIRELSARAARCNSERTASTLKEDAGAALESAWDWIKQAASDGSEEASKAYKCIHAGSSTVHNVEDGWKLMSGCFRQAQGLSLSKK